MRAASQLPGRGPTVVDMAPDTCTLIKNPMMMMDDDSYIRVDILNEQFNLGLHPIWAVKGVILLDSTSYRSSFTRIFILKESYHSVNSPS